MPTPPSKKTLVSQKKRTAINRAFFFAREIRAKLRGELLLRRPLFDPATE